MAYYDFDQIAGEAYQKMDGVMCWPVDWFREDLPIENKDGDSLDKVLEGWYNDSVSVPKTVENFVKTQNLQPAEFPKPPPPPKEAVLVFSDNKGYCQRILAAAPEGRIMTKKIVDEWESMDLDDVAKVISSQKGGWDLVIFGAGLNSPPSNHVMNCIQHQAVVSELFLYVLKSILRSENAKRLACVTAGCFSDEPAEHKKLGLGMINSSLLFGMCNSARMEFEETSLQYVDTEPSLRATGEGDKYQIFPRIASELFREQTFAHNITRILNRGRYVLRMCSGQEYIKAQAEFVMPKTGVIAISGGNGALGLVMGEWLLRKCEQQGVSGLDIQFLSRSMKITDLNIARWKDIQAKSETMGITVAQKKVDFSTQEATDKYMTEVSPTLGGFIHSAGILQDSMLVNLTWEKCEGVFDSKHRPALYLHSALERIAQTDLKFWWVFSSVSTWGNMGQVNYSGSNAYLDALCRHRIAKGKVALAIQWGAWGEVGMAATMTDSMRARTQNGPMPYFTNEEGLYGLECVLQTGLPLGSVFKVNPPIMFGMTAGADTAMQCHTRNFYSEFTPTPMPQSLERNHMYTAFRTGFGGSYAKVPGIERLIYDRFSKPLIEADEDEWGDDFRKWTPIKA